MLSWSPDVTAPSGANYVVNGYINDENLLERVETWLEDNIMGDMHIVASYSGWRDFGGFIAPTAIEQTRGGWPFFEVAVVNAQANMSDVASCFQHPNPEVAVVSAVVVISLLQLKIWATTSTALTLVPAATIH